MSYGPKTERTGDATRTARRPVPKLKGIFRTSTFRQALGTLLLVWLLMAAAMAFLWTQRQDTPDPTALEGLRSQARSWIEEQAEVARESQFPLDPDRLPVVPGLSEVDEPFESYAVALRQHFFDTDDEELRLALGLRLWALRQVDEGILRASGIDPEVLHTVSRSALLDCLYDEIPELLHEELDELIESLPEEDQDASTVWDEADDEDDDSWFEQLETEDLLPILSHLEDEVDAWEDEDLVADGLCWQLVDDEGELLTGNLKSSSPETPLRPGFLKIHGWMQENWEDEDGENGEDREETTCWVQEMQLRDGSALRFGRPVEDPPWDASLWFPLALMSAALLVVVVGSYRLAHRTARFVDDLRQARSRLEGDTFPRLRRPGDGGDFDLAAGEINAILERLDGALGSLTHVTDNIAHDLRTPLTRLQGQLDLLRRSEHPTEAMIAAVQEETQQLIGTFNALLRIAQVQSGSRRRGFRGFDFSQVVTDVSDLYGPAFADRGLAFQCTVPPGPVPQHGDSDLWMQALSNLIDNALKYTPSGGRVRLTLHDGPRPEILLRDSGSGIPEGELEKVFERFYRSGRQQRQRGAGLGLSLVAAVCKLHGATIELSNDQGLVVRVVLPVGSHPGGSST